MSFLYVVSAREFFHVTEDVGIFIILYVTMLSFSGNNTVVIVDTDTQRKAFT